MKKIFQTKRLLFAGIAAAIFFTISSCQKDKSGIPEGEASSNPTGNLIRPDSASANTVLTLEGSGLGEMRTIVFDNNNVPATFNPNFNTDKSLVFRVPDTAFGGPQNIIFTNSLGKQLIVPFRVIALPSVVSVSHYSFSAGEQITLTGNNLDNVSSVTFDVAGTAVTIVSKTRNTLVITMPASTVISTKLKITNASGTITTTQEFVNADQAFVFFRDTYHNGEGDASWGDAAVIKTDIKISGAASLAKKFAKGNWHNLGFGWGWIPQGPYMNISFWIRGGLIDQEVWIFANSDGGPGRDQAQPASNKIVVKAGVWQYFKIPLATLNLWASGTPANGNTINKLGWFLKGPDNDDETLYLDDVMFIK